MFLAIYNDTITSSIYILGSLLIVPLAILNTLLPNMFPLTLPFFKDTLSDKELLLSVLDDILLLLHTLPYIIYLKDAV